MFLRAAVAKLSGDWSIVAALGICFLAAALRIPPLRESLWIDELHTAWCALGPLDEVSQRAAIGNQGPLFYWLEWLLVNAFGASEFSLRLLSLISGSLLPLAVFLFARRWSLTPAGLVAAALIAVDHLAIYYSTEARPYALLQLLAVFHLAITAEIAARSTLRLRIAWIALAVALFYLHYTTAIVIVAAAAFLFMARLVETRRPLADRVASEKGVGILEVLIDLFVVGVLCLPQLANLRHIFAHRANWAAFIAKEPIWEAIDWTPLPIWYWLTLIVLCSAAAALLARKKMGSKQFSCRGPSVLAIWLFVIPICIAWLATWTDVARLFFPRYVAGALPAAVLCAGLCVIAIQSHRWRVAIAVATVLCAVWNGGVIQQLNHDGRVIADRNEDWRGCVDWLNERIAADGYPILVYSGLIEADELTKPHDPLLDEYCLSPVNSLYPLDVAPSDLFPLPLHNPGLLPQTAEQLTLHRNGCWIVVRGSKESGRAVASQICSKLQPSTNETPELTIRQIQSFGKVQVVQIANSPP
jgi:mannosyltransferase